MGRAMLKKRIIPVQLLLGERLVKTVGFDSYRDVGHPVTSSKVYSDQDADELVFLNIDRERRDPDVLAKLLKKVSEAVFMPLAVGGGIRSFADAEMLIRSGADKVVLNSVVYRDVGLLRKIGDKFGRQAVVVSIDVRRDPKTGRYRLFSDCGRKEESGELYDYVKKVTAAGAGELFVTSIDRDGMMQGYDEEMIRQVVGATEIPVIACGGAGTFDHMKDAFLSTGVSALACGSLFNFGDNNPIRAKAFLSNYGLAFKVT